MKPAFHEEWFSEELQKALAELVELVADVPGDIIEIGAWEGRSTCALANAAAPRLVHSCDTWQGSPHEVSRALAAQRDVHAQWVANVDAYTAGNVVEHRCDWRDYVPTLADESVALAFIDAEHTRVEVRDNLLAFLPKMAFGAVLCGDDAGHPPVMEGVYDVLPVGEVMIFGNLWFYVVPGPQSTDVPERAPTSSLDAMFVERCQTPSDIYLHLPLFVELTQAIKAEHVIELGTRTGVSTIAFLYALEGRGRLTSVDLDAKPDIGDWPHWTYIQGDDCDPDVYSALEPADIVFIDTSHHYRHTLQELGLYRWLVKPGGLILLHDTELAWPFGAAEEDGPYPVKRAVTEFCERERLLWENDPKCYGLAIIKVV